MRQKLLQLSLIFKVPVFGSLYQSISLFFVCLFCGFGPCHSTSFSARTPGLKYWLCEICIASRNSPFSSKYKWSFHKLVLRNSKWNLFKNHMLLTEWTRVCYEVPHGFPVIPPCGPRGQWYHLNEIVFLYVASCRNTITFHMPYAPF